MTATEELRRLLDERGVKYVGTHPAFTAWWGKHDLYCSAMEVYDGELDLGTNMSNVTPEQAIAATLGEPPRLPYFWKHDGTLHVELPKLPESISVCLPDVRDREVRSARVWRYTRDSGTCRDKGNIERFICSECGCRLDLQDDDWEATMWLDGAATVPNFCPNCGRKVVDE